MQFRVYAVNQRTGAIAWTVVKTLFSTYGQSVLAFWQRLGICRWRWWQHMCARWDDRGILLVFR